MIHSSPISFLQDFPPKPCIPFSSHPDMKRALWFIPHPFPSFRISHQNPVSLSLPPQTWHVPYDAFLTHLLPSGYPTKTLYPFLFPPRHDTCLMIHSSPISFLIYIITQIISVEEYKAWSSSLCIFLQSPMTFSLLQPNIFQPVLRHLQPIFFN